jgi:caa(3)-type oxidase subunit IV
MTTQENQKSEIVIDLIVYGLIMGLAVTQVIFAYETGPQLTLMLMIAVIQASLTILFFMHLRRERSILALALISAILFIFFMMNMIWSDSFRLLSMRPFPK